MRLLYKSTYNCLTVGVLNLGRRFKRPARRTLDFATSSGEGDNQEGENKEVTDHPESEEEEEEEEEVDYSEEKYPPADDKYKHLEDRLNAMEIQKVPRLDFEELGLVSRVVIPQKFKVPTFSKYDGVSCPKLHLRSYVKKIQPHTADKDLWVHFSRRACQGRSWIGSISWKGPTSAIGKIWQPLFTSNTSIMLT